MDDFIKSAVEQLGIDESATRNATGTVLGFLKESLGDKYADSPTNCPVLTD